MVSRHIILTELVISLVAACAPDEDASAGAALSPVNAGEPVFSLGVPRAEAINITSDGSGGGPVVAWTEDGGVVVGPQGHQLVVAYRDFQLVDGEVVRDIVAVRSSNGGETFGAPVTISDDRWFINACPFSGPSWLPSTTGSSLPGWTGDSRSIPSKPRRAFGSTSASMRARLSGGTSK